MGDLEAADEIRRVFAVRDRVARGIYCECPQPDLRGAALMCFACNCRHRGQEVAAVHRLVDAHAFVPRDANDPFWAHWCAVCTQLDEHPRHHGEPSVGTTSWGLTIQGAAIDVERGQE